MRLKRPCPTPTKIPYTDRASLKAQLSLAKKNPVRRYHCDCGAWHLTSWTTEQYQAQHGGTP